MTKKINLINIAGTAAIVLALTFLVASPTFARESEPNDDRGGNGNGIGQLKQSDNSNGLLQGEAAQLRVEPSGEFKASGAVVNSNAAGILNVKLFGINFNINANSAKLEGGATTTLLSDIAVGDKLSISGTIDTNTGAISAKQIADRTLASRRTGDIQSRIADLMRIINELKAQLKQLGR